MFLFVVIAIWVIGIIALVCHMVMKNNKRYKKLAYHLKNMPNSEVLYLNDINVLLSKNDIIECVVIKEVNKDRIHIIGKEYFKNNFVKKFQQY